LFASFATNALFPFFVVTPAPALPFDVSNPATVPFAFE
jgi:hypothetical protein